MRDFPHDAQQALFRSQAHSKAGLIKLKKEVAKDGMLIVLQLNLSFSLFMV